MATLRAIVQKKLRKSVPEMKQAVNKQLLLYGNELQAKMAHYPPQRAGARYRRTGTLGRGWQVRIQGIDSVLVFNQVPYSSQVEGLSKQAAAPDFEKQTDDMASRGWPAVDKVANEILKKRFPDLRVAISVNR